MKASAAKVAASIAAMAASGMAHRTAQAPGLYLNKERYVKSEQESGLKVCIGLDMVHSVEDKLR